MRLFCLYKSRNKINCINIKHTLVAQSNAYHIHIPITLKGNHITLYAISIQVGERNSTKHSDCITSCRIASRVLHSRKSLWTWCHHHWADQNSSILLRWTTVSSIGPAHRYSMALLNSTASSRLRYEEPMRSINGPIDYATNKKNRCAWNENLF